MIKDHLKTGILLISLTFILLILGFALGGSKGLTFALIFTFILNIASFWYSDKIALKLYRAQKSNYADNPKLHEAVKDIAMRAGIKTPQIYLIPSSNPNAFATGRNEKKSVVAVTSGLLETLEEGELRGVIAHEIAHIKNKDILLTTISSIIAGTLMYVAMMARWTAIFSSNRDSNIGEIIALSIIAPIAATLINLSISRSREFLADEVGSRLIKDPKALGEALIKIHSSTKKMEFGNPALSNMFISNPFRSSSLINLMSTHPTLQDRLKRLRKLAFKLE
jgi:heat shock protein HtpX|tara:strand:+ start:508 stop:1347 length:840 start_codon:yes stop_codon:yes gene_type:complete